eukprot:CAMPEP_0114123818 /NCGR_PEP_ID=MMETSP0043_2-20121206/8451_1 /TAXON_ID=464988 /ORGANISM="Hemiselmis andersenii, Strain CCMP644" /LENGTH=115 /DNA_ID=CAMNT_0001216665 /DNA_START=502 /DNA_END=849 /DNA_ORIENTATION=-
MSNTEYSGSPSLLSTLAASCTCPSNSHGAPPVPPAGGCRERTVVFSSGAKGDPGEEEELNTRHLGCRLKTKEAESCSRASLALLLASLLSSAGLCLLPSPLSLIVSPTGLWSICP